MRFFGIESEYVCVTLRVWSRFLPESAAGSEVVLDAIQRQDATAERHDESFSRCTWPGLGLGWGARPLAVALWNPILAHRGISNGQFGRFVIPMFW